jgi:hypothetical protein
MTTRRRTLETCILAVPDALADLALGEAVREP